MHFLNSNCQDLDPKKAHALVLQSFDSLWRSFNLDCDDGILSTDLLPFPIVAEFYSLKSMKVNLRVASKTDAAKLAQLHVTVFGETHGRGPSAQTREQQWQEILTSRDENDFTFVVENEESSLLGFARGTLHDGSIPQFQGRLNKLYVLKKAQKQGYGIALLSLVVHRFLNHNITTMLLFGDAQSPANGFFERFGGTRLLSSEGEFHGGYGWNDLNHLASLCHGYSNADHQDV